MSDTPKLNTYAMAFVFQSGAIVMHACCAIDEAAACALGGVAAGRVAEGELAGCQVMLLGQEWMRASLRLGETGKSGDVVSLVSDNQASPDTAAALQAVWPNSYERSRSYLAPKPEDERDPA